MNQRRLRLTFLQYMSVDDSWRTRGKPTDRNYPDWLNLIQHLSVARHGQIFLTLNPPFEPDPKLVFKEFLYDHPVLDANVRINPLFLLSVTQTVRFADHSTSVGCLPPTQNPHDPKHARNLVRGSLAKLRFPRGRLYSWPSGRHRSHPGRPPAVRDRRPGSGAEGGVDGVGV